MLDVDESLIAVNKFLATTDPSTSGAITAEAKENAATFVFTAALTSLPFSAVRLEVEGDVDAFEIISPTVPMQRTAPSSPPTGPRSRRTRSALPTTPCSPATATTPSGSWRALPMLIITAFAGYDDVPSHRGRRRLRHRERQGADGRGRHRRPHVQRRLLDHALRAAEGQRRRDARLRRLERVLHEAALVHAGRLGSEVRGRQRLSRRPKRLGGQDGHDSRRRLRRRLLRRPRRLRRRDRRRILCG